MDDAIEQHFQYEHSDDVDGVVATLSEDVEHDIVGSPLGRTKGRDGARKFYEVMFPDLEEGRTTRLNRYYGDNFMVDESLWEGRAVGAPFGLPGRGRPLKFRLLHVLEFNDSGEIRRENVWFDFPEIWRQLAD